ncbi:MAG TPA: hypothetical protein VFY40_14055 [Blastocatellia bacterium]|nr:hypothetical protein [Blastocatellia bacterium]
MDIDAIRIPLHRLAHGRAGDKGDIVNISLIAYHNESFPLLVEQVTEEKVRHLFRHRNPTAVRRYLLPKLGAMNFVLETALDGGVNESLNLDSHGKTLAFLLLSLEVAAPKELTALLDPIVNGEAEC